MLVILRVIFGAALVYLMLQVRENAHLHPDTGDLANAGYLALCVILGIANAVVWAPFLGAKVSGPVTDIMTSGTHIDEKNRVLQLIRWFNNRGYRRVTLFLCFLEGVRRPWMPTAFVIGLQKSKPGTWFEKVYAREVFRFNNSQNCALAYEALKRHGIKPGSHPNPEIDLALLALQKPIRPEFPPVPLPPAPQAMPLPRNKRIRLFQIEEPGPKATEGTQTNPEPKPSQPDPEPDPIAHDLGTDATEQGG
jgi:hypothetical protein